jgi:hypothetical protein
MTEPRQDIDRLIREVRGRLNRHLLMALLVKGLCCAGGILSAIALGCWLAGRRVALFWYPSVLILALAATLAFWARMRRSLEDAAIHIDAHFGLKDTVRSYRGFSQAGCHGDLYDLQAEQTSLALAGISGDRIRARWPVRSLLAFVALAAVSLWLTSKAGLPLVMAHATEGTAVTVAPQAEQLNSQIKEALEQIQEQVKADRIERQVAPEELQKMAQELKAPADLKEALRQYSGMEAHLNKMLPRLEQRKDEQLYRKMGEALQRSEQTKALGDDLAQRKCKEAGQQLAKLKIDKTAPPERKAEQLEKIKEVAQRMASEARQQDAASKAANLAERLEKAVNGMDKAQKNKAGRLGAQGSAPSGTGDQAKAGQGSDSRASASQPSGSKGSGSQGRGSESTHSEASGSEGCEGDVNDALGDMADHLSDLDGQCKARSAIQDLCKSLSDGQSKMCDGSANCKGDGQGKGKGEGKGEGEGKGDGQGHGNGSNGGGDASGDGGLKPGTGSSNRVNTTREKQLTSGQRSTLKGIQGQGPSVSTTEAATDGSGSSLGPRGVKAQQYEHQFEAFVRREDVSETVKAGVKAYFENLHRDASGTSDGSREGR